MGSDAQFARREFEQFFERHHRELSRLAYLVTGDHAAADDVTGDALLSVWLHWDRVQSSDQPIAYVRRMVLNIAASRVRTRVRERRVLLNLIPMMNHRAPTADVPAVLDVRTALLALPPRRRECVVLRYAFDLSEEEVSRTLNISVGTVKSQTSKGALQLRQLLGDVALSGTGLRDSGVGDISPNGTGTNGTGPNGTGTNGTGLRPRSDDTTPIRRPQGAGGSAARPRGPAQFDGQGWSK